MSCIYCGKGVSLVRKRTDPDFCCEDHRRKYRECTLRGLTLVVQADAQLGQRRKRPFLVRPPGPFPHRGEPCAPEHDLRLIAPRLRLPVRANGPPAGSPPRVMGRLAFPLEITPWEVKAAVECWQAMAFRMPALLISGARCRPAGCVLASATLARQPELLPVMAQVCASRACGLEFRSQVRLPRQPRRSASRWPVAAPRRPEMPGGCLDQPQFRMAISWLAFPSGIVRPRRSAPVRPMAIRSAELLWRDPPIAAGAPVSLPPDELPWPLLAVVSTGPVLAPQPPATPSRGSLQEDFSAGLENWIGDTGSWSRDFAGVRAGRLALFRPSLPMQDYRFEFLAKMETRSLSWVVRAADLRNYYLMTLVLAGEETALVRSAVIDGATEPPLQRLLRIAPPFGRPFRVQVDVAGAEFTTRIEDELVDCWTDWRLPAGGVGFLGEGDDRARIYWMKVSCT